VQCDALHPTLCFPKCNERLFNTEQLHLSTQFVALFCCSATWSRLCSGHDNCRLLPITFSRAASIYITHFYNVNISQLTVAKQLHNRLRALAVYKRRSQSKYQVTWLEANRSKRPTSATCQNVPVCFCQNVPVLLVKTTPWVKTSHQPKRPTSMVKTSHVGMGIQNVPASLVETSLC